MNEKHFNYEFQKIQNPIKKREFPLSFENIELDSFCKIFHIIS